MTIASRRAAGALSVTAAAAAALAIAGAAPATADEADASFLNSLRAAGVSTADPATTEALGRSICPQLVKPGSNFAEAVATARNGGVPPFLAGFFAGLAIQHYCPQMINSIGNGSFLDQMASLRGMNIPGL